MTSGPLDYNRTVSILFPVLKQGDIFGCVVDLCLMVWDATCPDTFAPSYRAHATQEPGKVTEAAEDKKYIGLPPGHFFSPIAIETLGAIGPKSLALLKELGRRIRAETGEPKSREYQLQRLSVAIQRGNCTSVLESTH